MDPKATLREVNLCGANMLGFDRDLLPGRSFDGFLTPDSGRALHALIDASSNGLTRTADLLLRGPTGETRRVHAAVRRDATADLLLIVLMDAADPRTAPVS